MNLRFVEAFYWVATLQSVSRAAEKLFITQSAMSARIAALEQELGTLLLDRRDKQFRLTFAGQRFLKHAGQLLELQREIKREMGGEAPPEVQMRIGAIESVLHSWLIPWVEQLRGQFPALELELTVETTPVLIELVRRGALDIVFTASPANAEGVRSKALPAMEMAFLGNARTHRKRLWRMADLADVELMTFQRGSRPAPGACWTSSRPPACSRAKCMRSRRSRRWCNWCKAASASPRCRWPPPGACRTPRA